MRAYVQRLDWGQALEPSVSKAGFDSRMPFNKLADYELVILMND